MNHVQENWTKPTVSGRVIIFVSEGTEPSIRRYFSVKDASTRGSALPVSGRDESGISRELAPQGFATAGLIQG
jgi:hypothetical protein